MFNLSNIVEAIQTITLSVHRLPLPRTTITGVSTDTRTLKRGEMFVALSGERFDGHTFMKDAFHAGCSVAIVSEEWHTHNANTHYPVIVVRSPLDALGMVALWWRRKFKIPVICIAGSNGKTSTKDMTAAVLSKKFKVHKTQENLNNKIGISKALLKIEKQHKAVVLELGTNRSGEIAWLCRIAEPTHGLLTNIGKDHLQYLRSMEGVAGENGDVFAYLGAHDGFAFVNGDDRLVQYQASYRGANKHWEYSFTTRNADVKGKYLGLTSTGGAHFSFTHRGAGTVSVTLQAIGEHLSSNALAAATVGLHFGVKGAAIKSALESYIPDDSHAYGRLRVEQVALDGKRGRVVTILNDTYNANPESTYAALESLFVIKPRSRHIAILGDMLELGEISKAEHENVGVWLLDSDIDEVFLVGEEMFDAYEAIKSNRRLDVPLSASKRGKKTPQRKRMKVQDVATSYFPLNEKDHLVEVLFTTLRNDDVVLVKGSRGTRMEEIITALKKNMQTQAPKVVKKSKSAKASKSKSLKPKSSKH